MKYYPESLKSEKIWVLWRLEEDEKSRLTKRPYSPHYDGRASTANPDTWGTFDQAAKKMDSRPNYYNGIGLIISEDYGLVFIDLDHCIDRGKFSEDSRRIMEAFQFDQYIERSQSGEGIHIITRGKIPKALHNSKKGVEIYSSGRFCALTGDAIYAGEPIEEQSVIDEIYNRYKEYGYKSKDGITQKGSLDKYDEWTINPIKVRGKLYDLFFGDWASAGYGSQSEADLTLCAFLAYWTNNDKEQIDKIFRKSGLYRDKWERDDYRNWTIDWAIKHCIDPFNNKKKNRKQLSAREEFYNCPYKKNIKKQISARETFYNYSK